MENKQNEKWIYIRVSSTKQDYESQKEMIRLYFQSHRLTENIDNLPHIEDYAQKRSKNMRLKNIWKKIDTVQDGATIYCSELSRLGYSFTEISEFLNYCRRKYIKLVTCIDGREITKQDAYTEIINSTLAFASRVEMEWKKERSVSGMRAYVEKGGKLGKASPNYGKNTTPEQHVENLKRGNIIRARSKNEAYVRSENVEKFCRILKEVRNEFKANSDKSKLFFEDFHKVNVRLSGDDYVNIIDNWNNEEVWKKIYPNHTIIGLSKAQNMYHTIRAALHTYEKNKNELYLL